MAVPPPPPPPGPPPPPMLNLNVGGGSNSGQERNALLQSIQKGTKLRPTKTVDKSKPLISGKVNDVVSSNTSSASSHAIGSSSTIGRSHNKRDQPPGQAKLGGLFEGMATMPRLKPVGRPGIKTSPVDDQPQTTQQSTTTPTKTPINNGSVGALDFQTELMNKLNRKGNANVAAPAPPLPAQKATPPIPAQPPINRNNVNRGPPPQPPKQNEASRSSPTVTATPSNGKPLTMPLIVIPNSNNSNNGMPILPNKSTLFSANTQQSSTPQPQSPQSQSPSFINNHQHSQSSPTPQPKPVINYGKPNLAPKPPLLGNGAATASTSAPSRPTVARHQSMRSPRSPPIAMTTDGPVFPSKANNFGTIRVRNNFASTDEINKPSLIGRPNEPPPKPPQFNRPPPPVPTKSHSNNDISIADGLTSGHTAAISSAKSEVTLNTGLSIPKAPPARSNSQVEADAPPLPPHRIAPKPNAAAPAVPKRTTSMQNQNSNAGSNAVAAAAASTVARRVIDLEMKFANNFHKANDFPAPPPFTCTTKSYPSQSGKNVAKG